MTYSREILVVLLSYMLGCISTGYYLTRIFTGKDISSYGSKSTGARNVARILGKRGFIITFLADLLKGLIVVLAASALQIHPCAIILSWIAVVAGHIWPVQLRFHGGKGIAVTIGALLIFDYWIIAGAGVVFVLGLFVLKKYIVSGLLAVAMLPLFAVLAGHPILDIAGIVVVTGILLFAHRRNIYEFSREFRASRRLIPKRRKGGQKNA